ncbi:CBO0543 family protein [Sutcliffiella halmapala]|uniref:CBO0543 family protein n=1 Tax=Sutcliffiella halmapala TaxID=79882 RepID=UPI000995121B|nr:CBO0543 family protein [Sutcliffiella halmapala]
MKEMFANVMDPILPKKFDENEVYTIIITILVLTVLVYFQKRQPELSKLELGSIYLFNLLLSTTLESLLADHPIDLYDTVDHAHAEIFDVILQTFAYPATIVIALYFYSRFKPNNSLYILLWGIILTILERFSLLFNLFQYKEWTLFYSFIFYILIMVCNIIFFNKVRNYIRRRRKS